MTELIDTMTGARLTVSAAHAARFAANPRYKTADSAAAEPVDERGLLDQSEPQIPTIDDDEVSKPARRRRKSEDA